jgi:transcription elongation factor GreA
MPRNASLALGDTDALQIATHRPPVPSANRVPLIMNKSPMTTQGAEKLRAELQELKTVARPKVIAAIAEARAHGDLKENAEYHAAREQQGFIEGRIAEIEGKLATANIIDIAKLPNNGKIVFGATVVLMNVDTEEEVTYKLVGEDEADIKANLISITSPVARALINKEEGEVAVVQAPSGNKEYEIVEVKYV